MQKCEFTLFENEAVKLKSLERWRREEVWE